MHSVQIAADTNFGVPLITARIKQLITWLSAYAAKKSFIHIEVLKGSSAPELAMTLIEKAVVAMKQNEIDYLNAITQAKSMLSKGLISWEEYLKIEDRMVKKYNLEKTSLYRANDLINSSFRVITMIRKEE